MLTQTSLYLLWSLQVRPGITLSHHLAFCCKASSTARSKTYPRVQMWHIYLLLIYSCYSFPARFNGAAAYGINSPNTQTIKFPPAAPSPRRLQIPARKHIGHCLAKSELQLGENNGAGWGYDLLKETFPPTLQYYRTHYRHACFAWSSSQDTQLALDTLV